SGAAAECGASMAAAGNPPGTSFFGAVISEQAAMTTEAMMVVAMRSLRWIIGVAPAGSPTRGRLKSQKAERRSLSQHLFRCRLDRDAGLERNRFHTVGPSGQKPSPLRGYCRRDGRSELPRRSVVRCGRGSQVT